MSIEIECPICGRRFVRGYWDHYETCSKRRQKELDQAWDNKYPLPIPIRRFPKDPTKPYHQYFDPYDPMRTKWGVSL